MKTSNMILPKKRRGRPATGKDPVTALRLSAQLTLAIEAWAKSQVDEPSRSEAIRRLVELGLGKSAPAIAVTPTAKASSDRAREMAGNTIDKLKDTEASPDDQVSRKRRLVKGPEEFQNIRRDRPNRK
jgi:hypothetical protein